MIRPRRILLLVSILPSALLLLLLLLLLGSKQSAAAFTNPRPLLHVDRRVQVHHDGSFSNISGPTSRSTTSSTDTGVTRRRPIHSISMANILPESQLSDEYGPLDYAITDSISLPDSQRPTLLKSISNPRDLLAITLLSCGLVVSYHNIVGDLFSTQYQTWQILSVILGLSSFVAALVQLQTENMISARPRRGVIDDGVMNAYAGLYSGCVTWLAVRTSTFCPQWVEKLDFIMPWVASVIFAFSLAAPIVTLVENDINGNGNNTMDASLSATMTRCARLATGLSPSEISKLPIPLSLSDTELMRVQGLLAIGVLGCVFVPDCIAFALGSSDWWDRICQVHTSQQIQESSTALFALYATEASMVATRCANKGVAAYRVMVPAFAGVCLLLAIVPCVCSLYWLGDDISFFSFYRE